MGVVVETRRGRLRGCAAGPVRLFRGIPFARPPVGPRRLRAPEPQPAWSGVRDALAFGPPAPQNPGLVSRLLGEQLGAGSEDCLTLNVWTPADAGSGRPVLVWIHGGGFTIGSGAQAVYDGCALAARGDVVVVTFNYRLGALGFLALPALAEEPGNVAGNFGLLDQLAALEWVRDEIEAFGGDPGNVTLFGESAGAMSVGTLLGVPRARGLFRRAILQSGAAHNVHSPETGARVAERFLDALGLGVRDVAALRALPVERLLEAQRSSFAHGLLGTRTLAFQPVVDGEVVPRPPLDAVEAGAARGVEVLIGTNLDEWKLFGLADRQARQLDERALQRRLERSLRGVDASGCSHAERAIRTYREARHGRASIDPPELWFAIESDRIFRHPATQLAECQAAHQRSTWTYLFTWASPALGGALGACHALELPFVFGQVDAPRLRPLVGEGPLAQQLSERVQDAWLAFAREGSPAHEGLPAWQPYEATRRATMLLGGECGVELAPLEAERRFWQELA